MRPWYWMACAALLTVGCQAEIPPSAPPVATDFPSVDTFTFDEIDIVGCGLTLIAPDTNSYTDGLYLFSGLPDEPETGTGSMRMKLDGEIVNFVRTETSGLEIIGGQFTSQTFVSQDGRTTVVVDITQTTPQPDPEVLAIDAATLRLEQDSGILTLGLVGDTGC